MKPLKLTWRRCPLGADFEACYQAKGKVKTEQGRLVYCFDIFKAKGRLPWDLEGSVGDNAIVRQEVSTYREGKAAALGHLALTLGKGGKRSAIIKRIEEIYKANRLKYQGRTPLREQPLDQLEYHLARILAGEVGYIKTIPPGVYVGVAPEVHISEAPAPERPPHLSAFTQGWHGHFDTTHQLGLMAELPDDDLVLVHYLVGQRKYSIVSKGVGFTILNLHLAGVFWRVMVNGEVPEESP